MSSLTMPSSNILEEETPFCDLPIGDLTILKGFPGIGKTAYATSLALSLAQRQRDSIYFTLCRDSSWLVESMKRQVGEATYQELKDRIIIDDTCSISVNEIRSKLGKTSATHVFVDALQWLSVPPLSSREDEIEFILQELKAIAVEYSVAVVAIYQISKGFRSRYNAGVDGLIVDTAGVHIYLLEECDKALRREASDTPQVRLTKQQDQLLEIRTLPRPTQEIDGSTTFVMTEVQKRVYETGLRAQRMIAGIEHDDI